MKWSRTQVVLAVVAVGLFALVAVLAFMALEPDQLRCTGGEIDGADPVDVPAEEALATFVSRHPELWPLDGWTVVSAEGSTTVFTNDDGGEFTVTVTDGTVHAFERCT